jgi:uncharacterized protein
MTVTTLASPTIALLVFACAVDTYAAGLDCKAASNATEHAICANEALRQLDIKLSDTYAKAITASPDLRTALRQQQRDWLQARNRCGNDIQCLTTHYEQRIAALSMPDKADMDALDELRQVVETARRTDPEFPLQKTIERLRIRSGTTSFSNQQSQQEPADPARFPKIRPEGVSDMEWRAMLASAIHSDGENGQANYTLLDLDGDGQRDLVIDTYTGGTGLFWMTSVLRQANGHFAVPDNGRVRANPASIDEPNTSSLYNLSGRGGNNSAEWIHLHGRVYVAYREGQYGTDYVSLLRPWHSGGQVPRLTIRYRYRLSVPAVQELGGRPATRLDPTLHRALNKAVGLASLIATKMPIKRTTPICPVPPDAPEDVRAASFGFGPTHYTIEMIADVPVWVKSQCYIGQVRNRFGGYSPKSGLEAELCMRKTDELDPPLDDCYMVQGPRDVVSIEAGTAPFQWGD